MKQGLQTTAVGSYPKPDYITKARAKFARNRISKTELKGLEERATKHWIDAQLDLGIDLLVDGEMYRGDMVTYFSEELEGFAVSGLVRSYGNRYYRKPIAVGPVGRKADITVDWWKYAQSLSSKPVKGMLTGPYTIADWSFNEYYPTREAFVMDAARAIHEEVVALEKAGCEYIQIDEPAISVRPEEMDLVLKAFNVVTKGINAFTITHICYGNFDSVGDGILRLPVNMLDMESVNSDFDVLEMFRRFPSDKHLSLGVVDSHNHRIESEEEIIKSIRKALEVLTPEKLFLDPDCGMKTRLESETLHKLKNIVGAVNALRSELGL